MQDSTGSLAVILAIGAVLVDLAGASCAADNCLRALRATQTPGRLQAAQSFCATFTAAATPSSVPIPSFAANACLPNQNGDTDYRLSSACACLETSTTSSTTSSVAYASTISFSTTIASSVTATSATTFGSSPVTVATACVEVSSSWAA